MCASDRRLPRAVLLLLLLACAVPAVHAQEDRRELQARRLQQRVQQLQQEQAGQQAQLQQAQQDKRELQAALEKARTEAGGVRNAARQAADLKARLQAANDERAALQAAVAKAQAERDEALAQLEQQKVTADEMRASLKTWGAHTAAMRELSRTQSKLLRGCSADNEALVKLGQALLDRYANKGVVESLTTQEPFLQTRRVTLEQYAQETRERLRQLSFDPLADETPK